jgi:hypothetical protein
MPPCCFASLSIMPVLLPMGDESAMNFEAMGGFFDISSDLLSVVSEYHLEPVW